MPAGTIFMHMTLGSIFVNGDDGKYYQPRPEVEMDPGVRVTFAVLHLPDAPPGFYFAGNVKRMVGSHLTGTTFMHPTAKSIYIHGEDDTYYKPRPEIQIDAGIKVTFDVAHHPDAPPGFYFAQNVKPVAALGPQGTSATTTPKQNLGSWGKPLSSAVLTRPEPVQQTEAPKNPPTPALPNPGLTPRTLTNKKTIQDFNAIVKMVEQMDWGRQEGFGPSVHVETPLKWSNLEGRELYLRVLEEYQDKKIPGGRLYYFVGTMSVNFGKAGFRISAHTHPKASIGKSKTYTVLHVEN